MPPWVWFLGGLVLGPVLLLAAFYVCLWRDWWIS
jgi:hypothetical protein